MDKREFEIEIWYFKPSGKFYTEAKVTHAFRATEGGVYMADVCAWIRGLRDSGGQGAMPGLSERSEGWDGFILVNCNQGFPCLIHPGKST